MDRKSHLDRAVSTLAAAGAVAHGALFMLFAWRVVTAGMFGRFGHMALAAGAVLGFVSNLVGWSLVRHGGRFKAKKYGAYGFAASSAIAAVLLCFAAW